MNEVRAAPRQPTSRTGIIEFSGPGNIISVPCTIRDISGTGAGLKLNWSLSLPEEVRLIFSDGLHKACRVAWQKRRLIGVAFADGAASPDEQAIMTTEEEQALHRRQIGARVKNAREARGYTEDQLANLLGVSRESVSLAEKGETSIPLHQLTRFADLLLVGLDWLVAGSTSSGSPPFGSGASVVKPAARSRV